MTLKSLLSLILFAIVLQIATAQEIPVDSLEKMSFEDLNAAFNNTSDTLQHRKIADVYVEKSLKTGDTIQICKGYYYYTIIDEFEKAIKYADTIISLSKNSKHKSYPTLGYILKGYSYQEMGFNNKALDYFIAALDYAERKNNIKHILDIRERIATLKSISGDNEGAIIIYKDIYNSMIKLPNFITKNKTDYFYTLYALITEYLNVEEYDSASIYINKAIKQYQDFKPVQNMSYYDFVHLSGVTSYYKKEYSKSIDSLKKAIPKIQNNDKAYAYFILSNIYKSQKKEHLFITNAIIAESLATKSKNDSSDFRELYENLIEYYKDNGEIKKELKYLNGLIKFDSVINQKSLLKSEIIKKYDTPYLLNQKQKIINQLNSKATRDRNVKIGLVSALLLFIVGGSYYYKKQRGYLKKYKALIANTTQQTPAPLPETNKTELSSDILERIQNDLLQFESNNGFLETKLTLAKLAEQLNTNSNYLSKAVNVLKNTSFSNYLHTLRINYIVEQLKNDDTLRRYTIKAIAVEAGYSNSQSFSTAFYKQTGIYPSYFLNKLNKGELV